MQYTIPELFTSRKATDVTILLALVLLGSTAFLLGRLSVSDQNKSVALCVEAPMIASMVQSTTTTGMTTHPRGAYVASKKSTVYHFPWCPGALRIKEEDTIWFSNTEEAHAAGYTPARNCTGL